MEGCQAAGDRRGHIGKAIKKNITKDLSRDPSAIDE